MFEGAWPTPEGSNVTPGHDSATVTLHFVETNGPMSTENAAMTFIHDGSGRLLIDTYRVV